MMTIRPLKPLLALASVAFLSAGLAPAFAATSDAAMLQSYAGNYTGAGTIAGDTRPQPVTCRLTMQSATPGKLDYTGRCSAGGISFSMTGIITAANGGFQAAMSGSGGGMSGAGNVAGTRRGNGVAFTSKTRDTKLGHDRSITSSFALAGGGIKLDFSMLDNKTGKTTSGSIAFAKGGR